MQILFEISENEINSALESISRQIIDDFLSFDKIIIAGIADGGLALSKLLFDKLKLPLNKKIHLGVINPTFYRDDFASKPVLKSYSGTTMPVDVDNCAVIICDDVFQSGRTFKAALDELFAQGRPSIVKFATLFNRKSAILPIKPDYVGFSGSYPANAKVKVMLDEENFKIQIYTK